MNYYVVERQSDGIIAIIPCDDPYAALTFDEAWKLAMTLAGWV